LHPTSLVTDNPRETARKSWCHLLVSCLHSHVFFILDDFPLLFPPSPFPLARHSFSWYPPPLMYSIVQFVLVCLKYFQQLIPTRKRGILGLQWLRFRCRYSSRKLTPLTFNAFFTRHLLRRVTFALSRVNLSPFFSFFRPPPLPAHLRTRLIAFVKRCFYSIRSYLSAAFFFRGQGFLIIRGSILYNFTFFSIHSLTPFSSLFKGS